MTIKDEATGIWHDMRDWGQYCAALEAAQKNSPHAKRGYGSLRFNVETKCGLTIECVGSTMNDVTCVAIGCLQIE